jgi:hypothetical protein
MQNLSLENMHLNLCLKNRQGHEGAMNQGIFVMARAMPTELSTKSVDSLPLDLLAMKVQPKKRINFTV